MRPDTTDADDANRERRLRHCRQQGAESGFRLWIDYATLVPVDSQ